MLALVIPVAPKRDQNQWTEGCSLLHDTLASITSQASSEYHAILLRHRGDSYYYLGSGSGALWAVMGRRTC